MKTPNYLIGNLTRDLPVCSAVPHTTMPQLIFTFPVPSCSFRLDFVPLLGAFVKLGNATISFVMSVGLSVRPSVSQSGWNNSGPMEQIFIKFGYFSKICLAKLSLIKIWQE